MYDNSSTTQRILNAIKKAHLIAKSGKVSLKNFELINNKRDYQFKNCWKVFDSISQFKLCLISYSNTFEVVNSATGGHMAEESNNYFVGFLKLNKDFGHTLIRPETFKDKINEIFNPVEIDFNEYKKFSRRYYVISNNETILKSWISYEFVKCLEEINNFSIELYKDQCLFRFPKSLSMKESLDLCKIGLKLDQILNN